MIGLLCFVLAVLASPFKSKMRLEAENAVLRHQLIVLRRKLRGRVQFANSDRWFFVQLRQNASVFAQGCANFSSDSSDRNHSFTPNLRRASPSLCPSLSFSVHTPPRF